MKPSATLNGVDRLCKDCRYCRSRFDIWAFGESECLSPQKPTGTEVVGIDPVTGKTKTINNFWITCSSNRMHDEACGEKGRWFVKR